MMDEEGQLWGWRGWARENEVMRCEKREEPGLLSSCLAWGAGMEANWSGESVGPRAGGSVREREGREGIPGDLARGW